jgi:hypothetical protein
MPAALSLLMTIFSKGTENITIFFFNGIFHIKEENEEFDKSPDNSILELQTGTITIFITALTGQVIFLWYCHFSCHL